jgi:asparagine synthase (glutamine-hydrolysing)
MARAIAHRGPDDEGFHVDEGIGLAFRRLAIIDLATGSQPLANEDGSVVVVFNGEIYNYRELREELLARGHRFRTTSDTETIVHLYEECGEHLLDRLNGMFAFALWDARRRRLLLARDPIGIKPLLYAQSPNGLVFGSEMGALLASGEIDETIDPVGLQLHLAWGAVPAPRTILRGVRRLEPGHFLVWSEGRTQTGRYWHPLEPDAGESAPRTFDDARHRLRELLDDSVRRQVVSEVPLGAFLSGGVDSTAIVGLMSRHVPEVNTFSVGFADDPVFDETRYARAAASFHGTKHVEAKLRARDIESLVPTLLDALEEPFGSASLLPTYVVSRATRERMTVALSGDGADELFGGYNKYLGEELTRAWTRIPVPLRRSMLEPAIGMLPASRASRAADLARKARRFVEGAKDDPAVRHERWMRFADAAEIAELVGLPRGGNPDVSNPGLAVVREIQADYDRRGLVDPLNRVLYTDLSLALPTDMLLKVDVASMRNSLEVRVPFLDPRIVRLAMSMPGAWKMHHGARKRVLKAAVRELLPPVIRRRPKAGFDVPVGEWIKTSMRDMVRDVVFSSHGTPLDRAILERWFHEHETARVDRTKAIWAVFTLRWWEAARTRARRADAVVHATPAPVEILG